MNETITVIYERGVLRPLEPLAIPEQTSIEIRIVKPPLAAQRERDRVRQALLSAGIIRSRPPAESGPGVSEAQLIAAAEALAAGGPLSELIIAERDGR